MRLFTFLSLKCSMIYWVVPNLQMLRISVSIHPQLTIFHSLFQQSLRIALNKCPNNGQRIPLTHWKTLTQAMTFSSHSYCMQTKLVPMSINGICWNHGCSQAPFFKGSSMRVLLHGDTWGFFHPWMILTSWLLMTVALQQANESQKNLQLYHDFLAALLQEVKYAAKNKTVMMINLGGVWQKGGCTYMYQLSWETRSHRTNYVGGSLLTQKMQEEFTAPAWLLACKLPT